MDVHIAALMHCEFKIEPCFFECFNSLKNFHKQSHYKYSLLPCQDKFPLIQLPLH